MGTGIVILRSLLQIDKDKQQVLDETLCGRDVFPLTKPLVDTHDILYLKYNFRQIGFFKSDISVRFTKHLKYFP